MKRIAAIFFAVFVLCISAFALESDDGVWSYTENGDGVTLTAYNGSSADLYVPSSIKVDGESVSVLALGESIFEDNDALNSVTLGAGIVEIGAKAFYDCDNFVCILLAEETTTVGEMAFASCDNMNSVILLDSVTDIGADAFADCPNLTIWCDEDSAGHEYAEDNGIDYELLSTSAMPETITLDGVTYYIHKGKAVAIDYDNSATTVTIPAQVNGAP